MPQDLIDQALRNHKIAIAELLAAVEHQAAALEAAIACGEALAELKAAAKAEGLTWRGWAEKHMPEFSVEASRQYLALARHKDIAAAAGTIAIAQEKIAAVQHSCD